MPTPTTWLAFVVATLALLLIPGPSVLYVRARTVEHGRSAHCCMWSRPLPVLPRCWPPPRSRSRSCDMPVAAICSTSGPGSCGESRPTRQYQRRRPAGRGEPDCRTRPVLRRACDVLRRRLRRRGGRTGTSHPVVVAGATAGRQDRRRSLCGSHRSGRIHLGRSRRRRLTGWPPASKRRSSEKACGDGPWARRYSSRASASLASGRASSASHHIAVEGCWTGSNHSVRRRTKAPCELRYANACISS